jgi:hypothetical protein
MEIALAASLERKKAEGKRKKSNIGSRKSEIRHLSVLKLAWSIRA